MKSWSFWGPMVGGLVGILIVGLVIKPPAPKPETQPGRYSFTHTGAGIYRMDTATGRIDVILIKDGKVQEIEFASAQVPPKLVIDR